MRPAVTYVFACSVALAAALFGLAVLSGGGPVQAQQGEGWVMLFDGKTLGDWDKVGETNWRVEDGAIVADKRTSKTPAYLLSKNKYKDFMLHVEFWASDDANSGIFLRCSDVAKVGDRTCYEANIFDQEITAKGRDITVVLNGQQTAKLRNEMFTEGPFGLQHGAGVIKFRKVAIKPL